MKSASRNAESPRARVARTRRVIDGYSSVTVARAAHTHARERHFELPCRRLALDTRLAATLQRAVWRTQKDVVMMQRTRRNVLVLAAWVVVGCGSGKEPLDEAPSGLLPGMPAPVAQNPQGSGDARSRSSDAGGAVDAGGVEPVSVGASAAPRPIAPCTGCVELVAPVSGANSAGNLQDQVGYQFNLPAPGADFRDARITWRVMASMNDDNLFVSLYAQNGGPDYSNIYPPGPALSALNFPPGAWVDLTLDLATYAHLPGTGGAEAAGAALIDPGTFDKTTVESFGIQLRTGSAFTGTRAIRLLIDSVSVEGVSGQSARTFDEDADGLIVNQYEVPLGTQPPLHH
jgi:hypothetical protein